MSEPNGVTRKCYFDNLSILGRQKIMGRNSVQWANYKSTGQTKKYTEWDSDTWCSL